MLLILIKVWLKEGDRVSISNERGLCVPGIWNPNRRWTKNVVANKDRNIYIDIYNLTYLLQVVVDSVEN